jgi:PAS domain S-box-containing protein
MAVTNKKPIREDKDLLMEDLSDLEGYIDDLWLFLPIPVCFVNSAFNILNASKTLEDITNYRGIEIVGESLKKILKNSQELFQVLDQKGIVSSKEVALLTKEGKEILVNVSAKARKDDEGDILGYFFSFIDLTDIKEKEAELRKKIKELEKFQKISIGRELKMAELKKDIERLKKESEKRSN